MIRIAQMEKPDETEPDQVQDKAGIGWWERRVDCGGVRGTEGGEPGGVRYLSLRLDDDSFVHVVETEADDGPSALPGLAAFKAFQNGIRERCVEPPVVKSVTIVGNYRMLEEP